MHQSLEEMFDRGIEREMEKLQEQGVEGTKPMVPPGSLSWALPAHIVVFLASYIKSKEMRTRPRLQDWATFRAIIFQIYEHRVHDGAQELNGAINTTHVSLDEHLVIFMSQSGGRECAEPHAGQEPGHAEAI